jgi:hypothetical protein
VFSIDLAVFFMVMFYGQIWFRLFCPCLSQPTSQSSPGRCPRFFTKAHHDFIFVFRFRRDLSSHLSASFLWVGFVDLAASCQCVVSGLVFSVSFLPGVHRSLLLSFFLRSDPSFVLGPHVLGLATANFYGYSVLLQALSQQIWSLACRSESPSSVHFISISKTSSFVFDLIEFLSLLTRLATAEFLCSHVLFSLLLPSLAPSL